MSREAALQHAESHRGTFLQDLLELLRMETISAQPDHAEDIRQAARWLADRFAQIGLSAEILDTKGHPVVFADTGPVAGAGPTVLVYGHYDVQPPGQLDLWTSGPFSPDLRDGKIFARGAADDKGQILTHLLAAQCWKETSGTWPLRLKFLIEGEEETGSPNLADFVLQEKDRLACAHVLISDTVKFDADTPAITYGTRGLVYKEIVVFGPGKDLHSGAFGGTVANPGNALARIIDSLKDKNNRVTISGFYNDVRELDDSEREMLAGLPFDEAAYLAGVGSPEAVGEAGYTTQERQWLRPTLDVNGLYGGYMEEGAATIIPAKVGAKISMRLVPGQDCSQISEAFDAAVRAACPPGVRLEIKSHAACNAYLAPLRSPAMQAAANAVQQAYSKAPVFVRHGGTLPILPMFKSILAADSLMLGYADPDCNVHSPDEWIALEDFYRAIRTNIILADALGQTPAAGPGEPN
jgi:acetylornithine deacetylase/succinyl-diaminopimelate desuccinylase-like protein